MDYALSAAAQIRFGRSSQLVYFIREAVGPFARSSCMGALAATLCCALVVIGGI